MSNTFGRLFRFTSFGESHGPGIGVVIDGCPSGLELDMEAIQFQLNRRKPGQSHLTTQRKESDRFQVLSGLLGKVTTGAPLAFFVANEDQKSGDYNHLEFAFRPSHADYTWFEKYGIRDHRGGGRASARETIARVIAGGVARQFLETQTQIRFDAWVNNVGTIGLDGWPENIDFQTENQLLVCCPDPELAEKMVREIELAKAEGDSLGGIIGCRISGLPTALGEPVYDRLQAVLGHAMLSINAVKGFEYGSGFEGSRMRGSAHNDLFYNEEGKIRTKTNHSGGIQGGISNGEDILFRVAFKPTSTLMKPQNSVNSAGESIELEGKGRHDPCVVPRAVPVVEAMAAVVMADMWLLNKAR